MVPDVAKTGTSFKGALSYYLHDKREAGESVRTTSERVAWTHTRNVMTNDPHIAGKVMAATAMDQDRLKREAGIKASGRKSAHSVYAYSLAWHPDEAGRIGKSEMLRAADESLLAIGAADHQAIIVCHQDREHPHIHVIVNRVSMEDGRMLSTSNDYKKLDRWALAYRQARGEEDRYCPVRKRKEEARKKREAGQDVEFVRSENSVSDAMSQESKDAAAVAPAEAQRIRAEERKKDAALVRKGKAQARRHRQEWADLDNGFQRKCKAIKAQAADAKSRAGEQVARQFEPDRRELHREQYKEKTFFEKREDRLSGKVENALLAIAHRRQLDPDGSRGLMGHAFNFLTSKRARAEALDKIHRIERRKLSQAQNQEVRRVREAIQTNRGKQLSQAGRTYRIERDALIARHGEEDQQLQADWNTRTEERRRAFHVVKRVAEVRQAAKERRTERDVQAKEDFTRAAKRTRKRSRTRGRGMDISDD